VQDFWLVTSMVPVRNRIVQSLSNKGKIPISELLLLFPPVETVIAESIIADMIDEGTIISSTNNNTTFLQLSAGIEVREVQTQEKIEIVATLPEIIDRISCQSVLSTRFVFGKIINEAEGKLLVTEPFIDNSFIEIFLQELRNAARRGVKLSLITRKVGFNTASLKALLRLYEIFGINGVSADALIIYEHWTPLRTRFDYSKQFIGLHSKIVINQKEGYIGSANWTEYSLGNNIELGILTKDEGALSKFRELFDLIATQARRVDMEKLYAQATTVGMN
jgi:HKD family nuclease